MSVFNQIKSGLEDSIAHSRGERSLVTTELLPPPPRARPRDVAALRRRFRMSQSLFAAVLNVSPRTVQSWEQGAREPGDAALRMLQVIRDNPGVVDSILTRAGSRPSRRKAGNSPRGSRKRRRRPVGDAKRA